MRLDDWPERLGAVLRAAPKRVFIWGGHDCALHACDGAEAVTGVDPGAGYRGAYTTYLGGMRLLAERQGKRSLLAWADGLFDRVDRGLAQRGDWALVRVPALDGGRSHPAMTIIDDGRLIGPCGVRLPLTAALHCWKVE